MLNYKFNKYLIIAVLTFITIFDNSFAKNSALIDSDKSGLNGYVRDSKTGETLIGATVFLKDTKFGSRTNKSGYFSLTNIPPGKYTVLISFLGYEKFSKEIELKAGSSQREEFELKQGSVMQEEVYVDAEREVEKRQISISKVNVPIQTIKNMRVGGESDLFRTLQYLPGVLTSSQISSGLFVRGGSPDQNLVLLDGSAVYNPTHLFGFISTFNTDAIKDVELIKGGFDAEYGGRLSAVLNITQNDGNRKQFEGVASLGAISSRAGLQGPIGNGSWFLSGRRTYFDLVKKLIPEDPATPIPDFGFYDVNAKITQDIGPNDKISISGFLSNDNLEFSSFGLTMGLDVGNRLLSGRWTHIFTDNLFTTLNASYSKYFNNFKGDQSGYEFLIDNAITDYTVKLNTEYFISDDITTKFGIETSNYTFTYLQNFTGNTDSTAQGSTGGSTNLVIEDNHTSAFGQFKWSITEPLSVQAGLRVNYWQLSNLVTYDPRISARYRFSDEFAVKAAWGIFHQNLRLASQPNFSFFDTWLPTDNTVPASDAIHYILSFETEPFPKHNINFDVYYKELSNVSEINTNALQGRDVADVFYIGKATAWGAEIFVQKKYGRLNGWVGYALGFISSTFDSINNGESFRPRYDRTHDFKVVLNYELNQDWDLGASFFYQTGQSYTGATSRFQTLLPGQEYGRGKIVPSQRFGLRLPASHQLNLTGSYKFLMWGYDAKFIIDIYNVYSRRDILVRFYNTRDEETFVEDVRLIPILPTVSLEVKF
jgi:outer membrane cobalamin receptor